jgi:DNA/RNA-binding domain of Phe-tRNA-synthetase-like protein
MVTPATTRALVVIFAPAPLSQSALDRALRLTEARIAEYCSG